MRISLLLTATLAAATIGNVALAQRANLPLRSGYVKTTPVTPANDRVATRIRPDITGFETPKTQTGMMVPIDKKRLNSVFSLGPGDSVGYTYYDFQTNASMPNRIITWPSTGGPSGLKKSVIWMAATDQTKETTTRGTYGAVTDGEQWFPMDYAAWEPLENPFVRTGFCEIAHFSTGELVITNHSSTSASSTSGETNVLIETAPGSGTFTKTVVPGSEDGGLWPRIAIGGNDVIHVIWTYQTGGSPAPANAGIIRYAKSTDKGKSWTDPVDLTGANSATGINIGFTQGGDAYSLAANGDHVVLWFARLGDLIQIRSEDAGDTWPSSSAILVFQTPFKQLYLTHDDPDSVMQNDGKTYRGDTVAFRSEDEPAAGASVNVMVDADGTVHGVYPILPTFVVRYQHDGGDSADNIRFFNRSNFNYTDVAMVYFEENNGTAFRTVIAPPDNFASTAEFLDDRGLTGGLARWPQLGKDADGKIYLAFGSGVASDVLNAKSQLETDAKDYLYSHIYAMYTINGHEWSAPVNLTPNKLDSQWPSVSDFVGDKLDIAYGSDTYPGDWLTSSGETTSTPPQATGSGLHPQLRNTVQVMSIDKAQLGPIVAAGVATDNHNVGNATSMIASVAPNPTADHAMISYTIGQSGTYSVRLFNSLGQEMMTVLDNAHRLAGSYTVGFDGSNLPAGSYLLVLSGNGTSSVQTLNLTR